ncbi:hypothetical protein LLH00_12780 [bacterium]|nr:hypothetical protein [bacterium]
MSWNNLADLDSVDQDDLNEYMSRPDERVLELIARRGRDEIVIYGATGKWMSDLTEMVLRAVQITGTTSRKVHLISRFSTDRELKGRFAPYAGLFEVHRVDMLRLSYRGLAGVPADARWVIYGIGYKFRTTETREEYMRLCDIYGKVIPSLIFTLHRCGSDIAMIGSGNPLPLTPLDRQAREDAWLMAKPGNIYGESIRNKEEILRLVVESGEADASRGVILRAMYMTNFTYGGLEPVMLAVRDGAELDRRKLWAFNIISHRDANIYAILAVQSASNPVSVLNISGYTVTLDRVADVAARQFGRQPRLFGAPKRFHLLADDSRTQALYGPPLDSLDELLAAQATWIARGGRSLHLDHKVGLAI